MMLIFLAAVSFGAQERRIPLDFPPVDAQLIESRNELWLLDGGKNRVVVMDLKTEQIARTVELGVEPSWIGGDEARIWVGACTPGRLLAIDTGEGKIVSRASVDGSKLIGFAATPARKVDRVWAIFEDALLEYDPASLKLRRTLALPGRFQSLTADGNVVIVEDLEQVPSRMAFYRTDAALQLIASHEASERIIPDPCGTVGFVLDFNREKARIVSLQSWKTVLSVANFPTGIGFHPDLPYAVCTVEGENGSTIVRFFSLDDEEFELTHPPQARSDREEKPRRTHAWVLYPHPSVGKLYFRSIHHHGDKERRCCAGPGEVRVMDVPFDRLKHTGSPSVFREIPLRRIEIGRTYRYTPGVSGTVTVKGKPAGATWDAQAGVFEWKPGVEDLGKSWEVTFVAETATSHRSLRALLTVSGIELEAKASAPYRISSDGKWLFALSGDPPTRVVTVDLAALTVRAVSLAEKATATPNSHAMAEMGGVLYIGTDRKEILRMRLRDGHVDSPIRTKYADVVSIESAPNASSLLVRFQDPESKFAMRMSSSGTLQPLAGADQSWSLLPSPDGKNYVLGSSDEARILQFPGKAAKEVGVVKGQSYQVMNMTGLQLPQAEFSHDGKHVRCGTCVYKIDGKTLVSERGPGLMVLDRAKDRYLHYNNGFFRVYDFSSEKPLFEFQKDQVYPEKYSESKLNGIFFSGAQNAVILTSTEKIVVVPMP